jgi:hypothetical protein
MIKEIIEKFLKKSFFRFTFVDKPIDLQSLKKIKKLKEWLIMFDQLLMS